MSGVTEQMNTETMALFLRLPTKHFYIPSLFTRIYQYNSSHWKHSTDCLLYNLLDYKKEVPASRKLFETYFIIIRYVRKEATYGNKYTREEELELFKNNITERLYFIYIVAKIQQTEEDFFRIWRKTITREGIINLGVVTTWKLPLQLCLPSLKMD